MLKITVPPKVVFKSLQTPLLSTKNVMLKMVSLGQFVFENKYETKPLWLFQNKIYPLPFLIVFWRGQMGVWWVHGCLRWQHVLTPYRLMIPRTECHDNSLSVSLSADCCVIRLTAGALLHEKSEYVPFPMILFFLNLLPLIFCMNSWCWITFYVFFCTAISFCSFLCLIYFEDLEVSYKNYLHVENRFHIQCEIYASGNYISKKAL